MNFEKILEHVENLVRPILAPIGLELIERELVPGKGRLVLRLYIDRLPGAAGEKESIQKSGVTVDDCVVASRAVEGVLEVEECIPGAYSLEVSSPGLNRPLRREEDFKRFAGERVELKSKQADNAGRMHFIGILMGLQNGFIVLKEGKEERRIPFSDLKKARIKPDFSKSGKSPRRTQS